MSVLETNRLILRQLCLDDVDDIYDQVYADHEFCNEVKGCPVGQ